MQKALIELGVMLLGRAPSAQELENWTAHHESGVGLAALSGAMLDQLTEAQARLGAEQSNEALLVKAYELFFDRLPDIEGLNYWMGQLEAGNLTRESLIPALAEGARAPSGNPNDAALLAARVEGAEAYLEQVANSGQSFSTAQARSAVAIERAEVAVPELELDPNSLYVPPESELPAPSPEGIVVDLSKGNVVFAFDAASVPVNSESALTITQQEIDAFEQQWEALFAGSQNFGSILTLTAGSDVLELVNIEFVGSSAIRDLAMESGWAEDWIDFAIYNGVLATPDSLNITEEEFFWSDHGIEGFLGYQWPWVEHGDETITRPDGQPFTLEVELLDALGINNLQEVWSELL